MDRWVNEWTVGEQQADRWIKRHMNLRMDRWTDGQMVGWTYGWTERLLGRGTHRQTEGPAE